MKENNDGEHRLIAHLLVKGYVQGVGYRNIVMRIARRMNVLGTVKNLDNGNVEIFCKCKDSKHLTDFIKQINIKDDTVDIYSPNVENIERHTSQKEIDRFNLPKEFGFFKIDYADIPSHAQETLIKMDTGSHIMSQTATNVKNMHGDMVQSFGRLDQKYDLFGKQMSSVHEDLKNMNNYFRTLVNYVTKSDKKKEK